MDTNRRIAYFSMEIGLQTDIPTYSGGLGILAGDTIRSAADLRVPMVAVSLLHRKGYFYQKIDPQGRQIEEPVHWRPDDFLELMAPRVSVTLQGRRVLLRAWKFGVVGCGGYEVPVYLLDSDLPENSAADKELTASLYGGDTRYRLCQEAVLGIGGVRMLRALGYTELDRFHMNEGHASLLALELLDEQLARAGHESITEEDIEAVRGCCVFTTHTPVAAGHDKFPMSMVTEVLGAHEAFELQGLFHSDGVMNMTHLALNLSHYVNGVAKRHGEVSRHMFSSYAIDSITNGVHAPTWISPELQQLFDKYIPGWRDDTFSLRYALSIPREEIWAAHQKAKHRLLEYVNRLSNVGMEMDVLTLGFARRMTAYKRPDLLFYDMERLRAIAAKAGRVQVLYAGKAHPKDQAGKELIQKLFEAIDKLKDHVRVVFLPNYDIELARLLTAGVDVWLNTPEPPMEASGTSGMKAALNGVPSLSILDGWWVEGYIEGETGWAIGRAAAVADSPDRTADAQSLYDKLQNVVIPTYYKNRERFLNIMMHSIALNGSFFNTQRMVQQYVLNAYFRRGAGPQPARAVPAPTQA